MDDSEFPVLNASATDMIPAFSVVRVTEFDTATMGAQIVDVPNEDNYGAAVVTGNGAILPESFGLGSVKNKCIVSYDTDDGDPAFGEEWGVKSGSLSLRKGFTGFLYAGGAFMGIANWIRKGASQSATIWGQKELPVSNFDIVADATWEDTGLSVDLPSAGLYMLTGIVTGNASITAWAGGGGVIVARLYDVTAGAVVASVDPTTGGAAEYGAVVVQATTIAPFTGAPPYYESTAPISFLYLVTVPATVRLEGYRDPNVTWGVARFVCGGGLRTNLGFLKVGN